MVVERVLEKYKGTGFADYEEKRGAFVSLPYSDLYWSLPPENAVYPFIHYFIPIERLAKIKQLGFLSYTGESPDKYLIRPYPHQREDHTWGVTMVSDKIAQRNGVQGKDLNTLRFSALNHDIATPAGGDAVKSIDQHGLNEETHWRQAVGIKGLRQIDRVGVNLEDIDKVILNEGKLGKILDISDRITYVMKDLYSILGPHQENINSDYNLLNLRLLLSKNPQIGNIYKEIKVDYNENVYFTNPDNLYTFLSLRAQLHKNSYMHPVNMARDMFMAELVRPFYSPNDSKPLTPRKLRYMYDQDLISFLQDQYKDFLDPLYSRSIINFDYFIANLFPRFIKTNSLEDASRIADEIENQNIPVIGIKEVKGFNTGVDYLIKDGRRINTFKTAYPKRAKEIENISSQIQGSYIFYLDRKNEDAVELLFVAQYLNN